LMAGAVGLIAVTALAPAIGVALKLSPSRFGLPLFFCAGCILLASELVRFSNSILEGLRRFDLVNILGVGSGFVRSLGILVVLWMHKGIVVVGLWYAAIMLFQAGVSLIVVRYMQPQLLSLSVLRPRALRGHLRFGLFSQLNTVLTKLLWESSPLIIGVFLGPVAAVPLYVGQRFPFVLSGLHDRSAAVIYPAASQCLPEDRIRLRKLLGNGTRTVMLVAMPCCCILWLLAPELLSAWLATVDRPTISVMRITVFAIFMDSLALAGYQILWATGRVKILTKIFSAAVLAMALALAVLMPQNGVVGAAWAMALGL